MDLKWPKYGTKFSVSYGLFLAGWALFGWNANVLMAIKLDMSPSSKEILALQMAFLLSLGKYQLIKIDTCTLHTLH